MKCYTYKSGKLESGVLIAGNNQKTCAINLNIPQDWDVDAVIQCIRDRSCADILLYGCTTLTSGDSLSSVFTKECALIRCFDIIATDNVNNSCLELNLTKDSIDYVLFNRSALHIEKDDIYILNDDGELKLTSTIEKPESGRLVFGNNDYEISL